MHADKLLVLSYVLAARNSCAVCSLQGGVRGREEHAALAALLADALGDNETLVSLKLEGPAIGDDTGRALAEMLRTNVHLVK